MRNLIFAGLISVFGVGSLALTAQANPINPSTGLPYYTDDASIGSWAIPSVDQLQLQNVMVGYPDGSFQPKANITREEFAVALEKAMFVLESRILAAMDANDEFLYNELVNTQMDVLEIAERQQMADQVANSRAWVGLSLGYITEGDSNDDDAYISLDARFPVITINDNLSVSVRPMVNTTGEAGGSVTLDYQISDKISVGAGTGVVGSWSDNSALAGDDEVAGYGTVIGEYSVSDKGVVYVGGEVPFTGDNSGDITVKGGFGIRF